MSTRCILAIGSKCLIWLRGVSVIVSSLEGCVNCQQIVRILAIKFIYSCMQQDQDDQKTKQNGLNHILQKIFSELYNCQSS
ncbi:hypothetical protein Hanom_Chr12g01176891 [Helianthus anomalus]